MSLLDTVRATMRQVIGGADGLCDAGWVRAITSPPTAQTSRQATYGLVTGQQTTETPDVKTGRLERVERASLRLPDTLAVVPGWQWSLDKITLWAIEGVVSTGPGSIRYVIAREGTERGQAPRGGGV